MPDVDIAYGDELSCALYLKGAHNCFYFHGLQLLKGNHPKIIDLKKQLDVVALGSSLWPASFLLIDYLSSLTVSPRHRYLDLGCGWGIVSAYLSKVRGAHVTAVDCDKQVFPFLNLVKQLNDCEFETLCCDFSELSGNIADTKVLVGADICYSDSLGEKLLLLIQHALEQGVEEVILSDKGRSGFFYLVHRLRSIKGLQISLCSKSIAMPTKYAGCILHVRKTR